MFNGEDILKSQQRFKSDHHKVCAEEVNKIALSSNDDKRLQAFDGIETYPYGTTNEIENIENVKGENVKVNIKWLINDILLHADL